MAFRSYKTNGSDPRLLGLVSGAIPNTESFLGHAAMPVIKVAQNKGVFKVEPARNYGGSSEKSGYRAFGADRKARLSEGSKDVPYNIDQAISGVDDMSIEDFAALMDDVSNGGTHPNDQMAMGAAYDAMYTLEKMTASLFFTAANWGTTTTCAGLNGLTGISDAGGVAWSDASSTPDIDLINIRKWVRDQTYGVQDAQMALRFEYETLFALQKHVASSGVIRVGDATKGIAMTGGQKVAPVDATIAWVKAVTGIQDVAVYSVRAETALPGKTSVKANVATSGSLWVGVQHGKLRPGSGGGTAQAVSCALTSWGDKAAYKASMPNREAPVAHLVAVEEYVKPIIFDKTISLLVTGCV